MKNLWYFAREYNEPGNSVPLPSYVCITFTNPEMTRRICNQRDPAVRVIGRCIAALVVNKLTLDAMSHTVPVSDADLACLSAILGTKSDDVVLLLSHPGAIEFTNMVFLAMDNFYFFTFGPVPPYVLAVVQQTSSVLSHALSPELNAEMQLYLTDILMDFSDGPCELVL